MLKQKKSKNNNTIKNNKELATLNKRQLANIDKHQISLRLPEKVRIALDEKEKIIDEYNILKSNMEEVQNKYEDTYSYVEKYYDLINNYNDLAKNYNKCEREINKYKIMFGQLESLNIFCPDVNKEIHLFDCNKAYNNKTCKGYPDCEKRSELFKKLGRLPFA